MKRAISKARRRGELGTVGLIVGGIGLVLGARTAAAETDRHDTPTVADVIQVVEITSLSASPDGSMVAFRTEQARLDLNTHILTWHVADLKQAITRRLGGGGAPLYNDPGTITADPPIWSPNSNAVFYRALVDDAIGIWRADLDEGNSQLVFRDDADVESLTGEESSARFTLGPSRDEVRAAERHQYFDGILVDASVALNQNLFRSGFVNGRLATQRLRGPWFTRVGLLWDRPRRQRTLNLETLAVGPAAAAPPPAALPELGVDAGISARSMTGATVRAVRKDGETRVEIIPSAGSAPIRCGAPACRERVVALAWRPGADQVLLTVRDQYLGYSLHLWDTSSGEVRRVASSDGYLAGGPDGESPCAVTRAFAVCVAASTVSPPRLERINLETGARTIVHDPNGALRRAAMPTVDRLAWSAKEGDSFTGILLLPPTGTKERLPLFINYYQCQGFLSGGVGDELPFLPLASSGMAVACINLPPVRGVEDFLGRYDQGLRAVRSLVATLDRRGVIDRKRVGMAGLSFGSEVTMWTLMHSDLIAAAAIASSQIEPTYFWFNSVRDRNQPEVLRRFWELGSPDETPKAWRQRTAAANVDRISAPLLMQLPEQEARNVIELYSRLSRSSVPTELYAFPDAAHLKLQPRHRMAAHQRYLDWFRFWLRGYADPDPLRADQYRRWNALAQRYRSSERTGGDPSVPR